MTTLEYAVKTKKHIEYNPDTRLALLEQTNDHIYDVLTRMEKKFDKMDDKLDSLENKFDTKFDKLTSKVDKNFYFLLTLYLGGFTGMFTVMAKGFHWF